MYRGTSPTIIIHVTGETFASSRLFVTLSQEEHHITKQGSAVTVTVDGDDSDVAFTLTQEQTSAFRSGPMYVQIRWITSGGIAYASPIVKTYVDPILLEGEIHYA